MKRIKVGKYTLILTILLVFLGCHQKQEFTELESANSIFVYCDEETNIEYLVFDGLKTSGITIRYNLDGSIRTCKK